MSFFFDSVTVIKIFSIVSYDKYFFLSLERETRDKLEQIRGRKSLYIKRPTYTATATKETESTDEY